MLSYVFYFLTNKSKLIENFVNFIAKLNDKKTQLDKFLKLIKIKFLWTLWLDLISWIGQGPIISSRYIVGNSGLKYEIEWHENVYLFTFKMLIQRYVWIWRE